MEITYKWQTYEIYNTEHSDMYFNAMIRTGVLELITKPEEKPTEEKWTHPLIPIAKALKEFNKKLDHDKAMEIPEEEIASLPEFFENQKSPFTPTWIEMYIRQLTSAVQQLQRIVFAHNNKQLWKEKTS